MPIAFEKVTFEKYFDHVIDYPILFAIREKNYIEPNGQPFKDFILSPTSPSTAFNIGEKTSNAVEMYLSDVYTTPVNLAGLPAVSIPSGFANKLPVGIQIIGNYFTESEILDVANLYQTDTDWHNTIPKEFDHE